MARLVALSSSTPRPTRLCTTARIYSGSNTRGRIVAASSGKSGGGNGSGVGSTIDTQLLEAAVKEPVAFLGGVFAGFLALDMQKEPLKSWLQETAAEAGLRYQATVERLEQERRARV